MNQEQRIQALLELLNERQILNSEMMQDFWAHALDQYRKGNEDFLRFISHLEEVPVSIEEFLDGDQFLGATDLVLWPEVRKAIIEIWGGWWQGIEFGAHNEAILGGATGTGKTELAKVGTAYTLHIIGCMRDPQVFWGLPTTTSIVIPIQAAKPHVVKKVVYAPLRKMVESMPWFQTRMFPDRIIESEMYFPDKNVRVFMGGSTDDAILGEAVIAAITDEINFMVIVENSKKAATEGGRSGKFDQAENIYTALTARKKRSFASKGPMVGIVVVSSSTRYRGDFTDRRMKHVAEHDMREVYVYKKSQYQVKPQWIEEVEAGNTFRIVISNEVVADSRILEDHDRLPEGAHIEEVPTVLLPEFQAKFFRALRDFCGVSDKAISPFIRKRSRIYECIDLYENQNEPKIVMKQAVSLARDGMPQIVAGHYCQDKTKPRYVHIDLAISGDSCGIGMVRYDGMVDIIREHDNGETEIERLPKATVELAIAISPDSTEEIDIATVRAWVKQLRTQYGYPIKIVTYDNYLSAES